MVDIAKSGANQLRRLARVSIVAFLALLVILGGIGWMGSDRAIHPAARHYPGLANYPDLRSTEVRFDSRTGILLAGDFFPGARRAAIVLSHGYGDNRAQMLPYAEFLHKGGYSVFTYDMRGRGQSRGDAVTLGALEHLDLISAVDYLSARSDVDGSRIGALGLSLGGSATLLAAASDPRIKAVVDDSGFSDAPGAIAASFEHFTGLPSFPFAPISTAIAGWRLGVDVSRIRPVDVVGRIGPRPLLVIECLNDTTVPPENSHRNFTAASEPKAVWRIPGCGHVEGYSAAPQEYAKRVIEFFDRSLALD